MPAETHVEVAEDGMRRLHPGYFAMQCPACKRQFLIGKPGLGELRVGIGLNCGRLSCIRDMGLEVVP